MISNHKDLSNKGERLVYTDLSQSTAEHLHRYKIASIYCENYIVVDIACGEGYGSMMLSKVAKEVHAFDIDANTIEHAKSKYSNTNLEFKTASALSIPLKNNSVDLIVSFETIEHLAEHDRMLAEFKRILKPNGKIIISTPDKYIYTDLSGTTNPHHIKELYKKEFIDLIKRYFKNLTILNQKFISASLIYNETINNGQIKLNWYTGNFNYINSTNNPAAEYIIIIASESDLKFEDNLQSFNNVSFFLEENYKTKIIKEFKKKSTRFKLGNILLMPLLKVKRIFS